MVGDDNNGEHSKMEFRQECGVWARSTPSNAIRVLFMLPEGNRAVLPSFRAGTISLPTSNQDSGGVRQGLEKMSHCC